MAEPLRTFTLIVPYYRNCAMLMQQLRAWEEYPPQIPIIVVDDGSLEDAYSIITDRASEQLLARLSLYRIGVDIPWNRGGARNLGAQQARTEWIVHIDIDHILPTAAAAELLNVRPNPRHWYRFERYRVGKADETRNKDKIPRDQTFGKIHPHMDSYLCTRRMYWAAGGYDEDYSGCLGGGSPFLAELIKEGGEALMLPPQVPLHVYTRSVVGDASDLTLSRDRARYAEIKKAKAKSKKTRAVNPIRFEWIKEELMYPPVAGEFETITEIIGGKSISRFGDGEVKVLDGKGYTRELEPNAALTAEMRAIASSPAKGNLIGIPTMDPRGTKYENWKRHKSRFLKYFNKASGIPYFSALITRPDCGTWLETRAYYEHVIRIWRDKGLVAVVSEPDSKLLKHVRSTHRVVHVECPMYNAYSTIDRLEREVVAAKPDIALLSVGVTATCLANRLCTRGIQAVDLGSIGGFLLRWKVGGPKPTNYAEERGNDGP